MKTIEVEIALLKYFDIRRNLIVTNVSDFSGLTLFESDLLVLSKSGYASTVEIKVSKADLKNDLKKKHIKILDHPTHSDNFIERYYKPFRYFYYAVPLELKEFAIDQIPDFAGLLTIQDNDRWSETRRTVELVKPCKQLYKTKWTEEQRYQLSRLGAMRVLTLKQNIAKLQGIEIPKQLT
jgi:hypothetical protein